MSGKQMGAREQSSGQRIRKLRGYLREMANSPVYLVQSIHRRYRLKMLVEDRLWKVLKATLWNLDIFVLYINLLEESDIITALRYICGNDVHKRNLVFLREK